MAETALIVMSTYTSVEVGLYNHPHLIATNTLAHKDASRQLMVTIAHVLERHGQQLINVAYIAASQGPGPFTTLRTVIASVNGLAFATSLPLIGVDVLTTLVDEYHDPNVDYTVALLNAFGGDVYYGVRKIAEGRTVTGYQNALAFLQDLAAQHPAGTLQFVGGGVMLWQHQIRKQFGTRAIIRSPVPEHCSLAAFSERAYAQWHEQENRVYELYPLYLKAYQVKATLVE